VQDTGPGIPPEDIPHLFQKFYRVDNSMTRTIGGTGLGLFICRKIVELYNGRIWAESQLGKGTIFFVNLPRLTTAQALDMQKKQVSSASPLDSR
jgi:two-component system, OmpR family, sensor histidine kinase VicK